MLSRALVVLLAVLSAAAILPGYKPPPTSTSTSPSTEVAIDRTARPTVARLATRAPALPLRLENTEPHFLEPSLCQYTYCDEHQTRWCFYWDGVTAYDESLGPVPAETRAYLGTCHVEPKTETVARKYCGHA